MSSRLPFHHVAILVPDVEQAAERLGKLFGWEFCDTKAFDLVFDEGGSPQDTHTRCKYSLQGPPFVELLERSAKGVLSTASGGGTWGVHHVGMWLPSIDDHRHRLNALGVSTEAHRIECTYPDGMFFGSASDLFGVRMEFVEEGGLVGLHEWIGLPAPSLSGD